MKNARLLALTLLLIVVLTFFGPEEQSLGSSVRVVYLHDAWVLTAEIAFAAAAAAGLFGFILKKTSLHRWSAALGYAGLIFWLTYLPLSLWAMQTNWNGLFLAEPRFHLAISFAVAGILLQSGLFLLAKNKWISLANILYFLALRYAFSHVANVMHPPPSPILKSGNWRVIGFFLALNLLTLAAGWLLGKTCLVCTHE